MQSPLNQFLTLATTAFSSPSSKPENLVQIIPLNESHPFYAPLRQSIPNDVSLDQIRGFCGSLSPDIQEVWAGFLFAYLNYLRCCGQVLPSGEVDGYGDFERLSATYTEANRHYSLSLSPNLNGLILNLAKQLHKTSHLAAIQSTYPPRHPKSARSIRDSTRQVIEKSFQNASSAPASGSGFGSGSVGEVGDVLWGLGNVLWRIYAERKLHTQATDLQKTFSSLSPSEESRLASRGMYISAREVGESYYWRGKLGVVLLDMRGAKFWLEKAWEVEGGSWAQRRSILIRLIPVNLLLGHLPSKSLITEYNLQPFTPLIQAFKSGNIPAWRQILDRDREWYRRRSIWLILFERGEILVWRNLWRQSLKVYHGLYPDVPKNRCPTWVFVGAMRAVFDGSGEVEEGGGLEDVICVIASLIDQSLILGHLSYSQQQLVMKPSSDGMGGFPRVSGVVPRRVEANV